MIDRSLFNLATIVCGHAHEDEKNIEFICRDQTGWVFGCDEGCPDFNDADRMKMVCLGHFFSLKGVPETAFHLPKNTKMTLGASGWGIGYLDGEHEPEEGDFISPPDGHTLRDLPDDQTVFAFRLPWRKLVTVTFDEGTFVLPFWLSEAAAETFRQHLAGFEKLVPLSVAELRKRARKQKVEFLAADFLKDPHDLAVIP